MKRFFSLLRWLILLAILFFWGRSVWLNREVLAGYPWRISWIGLVSSAVVLAVQAFLLAALWRKVLALTGVSLPWRQSTALWLQAQIARYVPGAVWEVAARVLMGRRLGVSGRSMSAAYGLELGLQVLSGSVFLLAALALRAERPSTLTLVLGSAALFLALVALAPPVFNRLVNWGLALLRRPAAPVQATYRDMVRLFGGYVLAHLLSGIGFVSFVYGVQTILLPQAPLLALAYVGAWLLGQVALFAPAGIGVREGALGLILSSRYPFVTISTLALAYRMWIALRDLMMAAYGKWLDRRSLAIPDGSSNGQWRHER